MPAEAVQPFTAVILAARRGGRLDPLAARAEVTHKSLVPILGRPLIQYVLEALAPAPGLKCIRICVEPEAAAAIRKVPGANGELGVTVDFVASGPTITDSAYVSAEGIEGPILFTTADNVNLTPTAVAEIMRPIAAGADVAIGFATREAVLAARCEAQLAPAATANVGPYRFSDGRYSNCNLYALAGKGALKAAEAFREGGQFSKSRKRLVNFIGVANVILYGLRLLTLERAMKRISRRFGVRVVPVVLEDGAHAVDVDNPRTYTIAEAILKAKAAKRSG
jgi:choline kinase